MPRFPEVCVLSDDEPAVTQHEKASAPARKSLKGKPAVRADEDMSEAQAQARGKKRIAEAEDASREQTSTNSKATDPGETGVEAEAKSKAKAKAKAKGQVKKKPAAAKPGGSQNQKLVASKYWYVKEGKIGLKLNGKEFGTATRLEQVLNQNQ